MRSFHASVKLKGTRQKDTIHSLIVFSYQGDAMSLSKAITFRGYEILAKARLVTADDWVGGYVVTKDNKIVRIRNTVVYRETADAAVDSALVYGVQFVDRCELTKS